MSTARVDASPPWPPRSASVAVFGAGGASAASSHATAGINVYAAASLTDVFPAIDGASTYNFAGSNALATQITNGAPADVFASANTTIPRAALRPGLVEKPVVFTRNTLVSRAPKSNPAGIKSIYDLTKPGIKLVIAELRCAGGQLHGSGPRSRWGCTSPSSANVVSQETDVRTRAPKVQLGQGDAGFVYSTDAQTVPAR